MWSAGFALSGLLRRSAAARWSTPGGERVLVVAPHPDDEVAGCGGAVLAHRRAGERVVVCCVTDGRRSRALGISPDETAAVRREEMAESARALDAELVWLGLPEGEWEGGELVARLGELLAAETPDVVYAPSRIDFHPEHARVARALARALGGRRVRVRIYPVHVPLTAILCNLVLPVDLDDPALRAAFAAHASQRGSLARCRRHRGYVGRRHGAGGGAEEYWQLEAEGYARLHGGKSPLAPLFQRGGPEFRGLRYIALSDPLAYLRGRGERRRLRRRAE